MGPKKEQKSLLVSEPQDVDLQGDIIDCVSHDGDDYYESPVDWNGNYYCDRISDVEDHHLLTDRD